MSDKERDVTPEAYHRAVVEAFLYYFSSHAREHSELVADGVREGVKQWLDDQARSQDDDMPISQNHGAKTEFHAVLEEIYNRIDEYGRLSRQWGREKGKAEAKGEDLELDQHGFYEAEKRLKLNIENLVNENVRLNQMLATVSMGGGSSFEDIMRSAIGEWLDRKGSEFLNRRF